MIELEPTEAQWTEWFDLQRSATKVWIAGDLRRAIAMLDEFIAVASPAAINRQAIGFRGSLHQEAEDLHAARRDFLSARELSEDRDFERYSLEESIAAISQLLGDLNETERWCLEALQTAAADPRVSGAGCLQRLLVLRGEGGLRVDEYDLAVRVVHQAWSLLRVEGEPDLRDFEATCRKLTEAQRGPFTAARPPHPQSYTPRS